MMTWHLDDFPGTWALLQQSVRRAFDPATEADPQLPCTQEVSLIVKEACHRRWAKELYAHLVDELQAQADAVVARCAAEDTVAAVAAAWRAFSAALRTIDAAFRYVDQSYATRREQNLDSVRRVGLKALRRSLEARGLYEPLSAELVRATRLRLDGEALARCRACVACLQALDWYAAGRCEKGPYLEELVLRAARDLYTREAAALDSENPAEYARRVVSALNDTGAGFLDAATAPLLTSIVEAHLVAPSIRPVLHNGLGAVFDGALASDPVALPLLAQLGALARRGGALVDLRHAVATHAARLANNLMASAPDGRVGPRALELLEAAADIAARAFAPPAAPVGDAVIAVNVWDALARPGHPTTEEEDWGAKCVTEAVAAALNDDVRGARFADCVARAFDDTLSSGGDFHGLLVLFRLCRAKDMFEATYRADLGLRLLRHLTQRGSEEKLGRERDVVARFEKECGAAYVAKLEGMCADAARSVTSAEAFRQETSVVAPILLTRGHWPAYPESLLVLPPPLQRAQADFEAWYVAKFQGRRLRWHADLGTCAVDARYATGSLSFDVAPAQSCVLVALNDGTRVARAALASTTGLDGAALDGVTSSLVDAGLVVCIDGVYAANLHKPAAIVIAPPRHDPAAPPRARVADSVRKDRAYAVDAAVVRIMKARRTLPAERLVADVRRALVHPASESDVAGRIDSLVDREYLERDDGVFNYLA